MNVDRSNFSRIYPEMVAQIKECDLIAFDLEYSGIKLSEQSNYNLFDTMEDRYQHIKSCSKSFTTFQLGIVLFTRIVNDKSILFNTSSKFITKTYNLNIFPTGSDLFDTNFTCSAGALKFLRTNHMNINDIIDKGIGFLNKEEFVELKSRLDSYSNVQSILTEEQQRMLDSQRKQISEWLTKMNERSLQLPLINRFSPYFQQMYFRSHFIDISTKLVEDHVIIEKVDTITRFSIDQKEDEMDVTSEKYKFCMEMLGVSKIWKLIARLKKPVVGHNCLFDLVTIYQKFFANLPEKFDDFRFEMNKSLPTIYDTKFIFGRMRMNFKELAEIEGGLQTIFNALSNINLNSKDEAVVVAEDSEDTRGPHIGSLSCQAHEAGYDSFMTGCCLLFLANMLYRHEHSNTALNKAEGSPAARGAVTTGAGMATTSGDSRLYYDNLSKRSLKISVAAFETYEGFLKPWKNFVNVIKAHQFCVCIDASHVDETRTAAGNRLSNTRPPFLVVYDRCPGRPLVPVEEAVVVNDSQGESEELEGSDASPPAEVFFSQAFLEQLLFEFGHADVRKLGSSDSDERQQRFLVAMSSFNVARVFQRSVRRRWPRLVVRDYSRLADDRKSRACFFGLVGVSTALSAWSIASFCRP